MTADGVTDRAAVELNHDLRRSSPACIIADRNTAILGDGDEAIVPKQNLESRLGLRFDDIVQEDVILAA